MKGCKPDTSSYNTNQVVHCAPQGSNANRIVAVSKWKVMKLFQATEMQAGIFELHFSNSEGKLRTSATKICCSACSFLSFFQFEKKRKGFESVRF